MTHTRSKRVSQERFVIEENETYGHAMPHMKFLNLIRALFPKWSFFDEVGYRVVLQSRTARTSNWETVPLLGEQGVDTLFLNPATNLAHAKMNVLAQFVQEVQKENVEVQALQNFHIVKAIAGHRSFRILIQTPDHHDQEVFVHEVTV